MSAVGWTCLIVYGLLVIGTIGLETFNFLKSWHAKAEERKKAKVVKGNKSYHMNALIEL